MFETADAFSFRSLAVLALLLALDHSAASGQTEIPLDHLPPPPTELRQLVEIGRVTFESADGLQTERASKLESRFAAETRFLISFNFETRTSWRMSANGDEIHITVLLRRFRWEPVHTIWFRKRPAEEGFWSSPLVLHEFDHVRLSTDPRLKASFDRLLREPIEFSRPRASDKRVDQPLVNRLADEHIQEMFQKVLELIQIRYRELDRETMHGKRPLGDSSPLRQVLRGETQDTPDSLSGNGSQVPAQSERSKP